MDWWANLNNVIYAVMLAVTGAFVALIRKILTNEKRISLLEAELKQRNEARKEMDIQIAAQLSDHNERIDSQLKEIRFDIKDLLISRATVFKRID